MSRLEIAPDTRDIDVAAEHGERLLAQTWQTPPGLWGALTTVDHKIIGRRYILTAFVFLALGGVLAMLMRLQLARPESRVLSADLYNQVFTVHGSNMMFLFAVPVMEAMGVFLVPLMVGTRNIAFPRSSTPSRIGSISRAASCCGRHCSCRWDRMSAGSPMCPSRAHNMGPASATDMWAQMITFTELSRRWQWRSRSS